MNITGISRCIMAHMAHQIFLLMKIYKYFSLPIGKFTLIPVVLECVSLDLNLIGRVVMVVKQAYILQIFMTMPML